MQGAGSLACGMENDGISEFCRSTKTLGVLCRVYDPKISHFLELDVLPQAISARN